MHESTITVTGATRNEFRRIDPLTGITLTMGEGTVVRGDTISYSVSLDPGRSYAPGERGRRYPGEGNRLTRRTAKARR